MTIETKYNPGDFVYYKQMGKDIAATVEDILFIKDKVYYHMAVTNERIAESDIVSKLIPWVQ